MKRFDIFFVVFFLGLLFLVPSAKAQGTYTAATCNYSDVNAVINGPTHKAVSGDVINIPAGTCTWTNTLFFSAGITLTGSGVPNTTPSTFGAGTLNTIIKANTGGATIAVTGLPYGQTVVISLLDLEPAASNLASPIQVAGSCTASGCPSMRLSNIGFGLTTPWTPGNNGTGATWLIRSDNVFGVIDHCTEPSGSDAVFDDNELSAYLGVGAYGDNSWAQPDTFGTDRVLYLENNNIYVTRSLSDCEIAAAGGSIGGCRSAGRFNHITSSNGFGVFGLHGLDTDGRPRGGRQLEVYGNSIQCIKGGCNIIAGYRGGTGFTFGNSMTEINDGFFNSFINISVYRNVLGAGGGWGTCGGSSPYDTNDGTTAYSGVVGSASNPDGSGHNLTMTDTSQSFFNLIPLGAPYSVYNVTRGWWSEVNSNTSTTITIVGNIPETANGFNAGDSYKVLRATVCADQGGRGQGVYVSGTPPTPGSALNEVLNPVYEWNDSESPVRLNSNGGANTKRIIVNRDWYTDNSHGTPQAQTSPTSPFNGTSGVGFGTLANRPTTCTSGVGYFATDQGSWNNSGNGFGNGVLYQCAANGTWTVHYTPYSYPHPLTQGAQSTPVAPPTNLQAIFN